MSPVVTSRRSRLLMNEQAGQFFRIGLAPTLIFILALFLAVLIFVMASQVEVSYELLGFDPETAGPYIAMGMTYAIMGSIALGLLAFIAAVDSLSRMTGEQQVFRYPEPKLQYMDIMGFFITMSAAFVYIIIYSLLPMQQTFDVPQPILQLVVATIEEVLFRFALPAFLFIILGFWFRRYPLIAILAVGVFSSLIFGMFHIASYTIIKEHAIATLPHMTPGTNDYIRMAGRASMDVTAETIKISIFGFIQYIALITAMRIFGGGEWALAGVIGGHYTYNLMIVMGLDQALPYVLLYIIIILLVFVVLWAVSAAPGMLARESPSLARHIPFMSAPRRSKRRLSK